MEAPRGPASSLSEAAKQLTLEPLKPGDPRHTDLSAGQNSQTLPELREWLRGQKGAEAGFAHAVFRGHRGSGKTTELLRLEHELERDGFTCVHLTLDDSLRSDCDYTHLLLWTVESVVRRFAEQELPLNEKLATQVARWFDERVFERTEAEMRAASAELESEAQAGGGLFGFALRALARVKSAISGSDEKRLTAKQRLQAYSSDLIDHVNLLLDDARRALQRRDGSANLLVVQDNLDRLEAEPARRLFFDYGDLLQRLRVHAIYTAPVPLVLAPYNLGKVFDFVFDMPMVKTLDQQNKRVRAGIDCLVALARERLDLQRCFESESLVKRLAEYSGGSVRDFMRLLNYAELAARTDGKFRIDAADVERAETKLRIDYEKILVPPATYFPLLARAHHEKTVPEIPAEPTQNATRDVRTFIAELLFNGSLLEYNGNELWYDAHPAVRESRFFRDAYEEIGGAQAATPRRRRRS